jgi:hypothetical protein
LIPIGAVVVVTVAVAGRIIKDVKELREKRRGRLAEKHLKKQQ